MIRMLALALGLLMLAVPTLACNGSHFAQNSGCLEQDLRQNLVREVYVGDHSVTWAVQGSPGLRYEAIRLGHDEVGRLRREARARNGTPTAFTITSPRRHEHPMPFWMPLVPATGCFIAALSLAFARRRRGMRVRLLTRRTERREAFVLLWVTALVAGLVWSTWSTVRPDTLATLGRHLEMGLVHDVTYRADSVVWREVDGSEHVANERADLTMRALVDATIIHLRDPEHPRETLHRPRVHVQDGGAATLDHAAPWIGAIVFWFAWLRMVRRQSWW